MAADSQATLPSLTEAVKRLTTDDRKRAFQDRGGAAQGVTYAGAGKFAGRRGICVGCKPDQHGAHVHGALGADSG